MEYKIIETIKQKRSNSIKVDIYYLIQTKFGICKTLKTNWDKGCKPGLHSALNKTTYFINMSNEIHKSKYKYAKVVYKNKQSKVLITCTTHGDFYQNPTDHLLGKGCPKCCGKNKTTEDFVIQANKIHNNKYEYIQTLYTKSNEKIIITCKLHGNFDQMPTSHLSGIGCPTCGKDSLSGHVWSHTKWNEMAKTSKYFDSFKVYILECSNNEEMFLKIGKTYNTTSKRFSGKKMPYNFKIIKEVIFNNGKECCEYEKQLHKAFINFRYFPKIKFSGDNECFNYNILKDIDDKSN